MTLKSTQYYLVSRTERYHVSCGTGDENRILTVMTTPLPLVERKRRQARERIVQAAEELFLTRGFDDDLPSREPTPGSMPMATFAPMRGANGSMVPAFAAMGSF